MKKILAIILIAVAMASCSKQTPATSNTNSTEDRIATPPKTVSDAFVANFGNVAVTEWKLRTDNTWRAHFTNNGKAWEATFSSSGALLLSQPA